MAEINVGDVVGHLKIDLADWQRGLQQAQAQLAQFHQAVTQQAQQGTSQTAQALRAEVQLRLAAIREQMQAARQAAQEHLQVERQSSAARLQAAQQASAAGLQAARQASTAAIQAARQASTERIAAARAAGQAEVLEFRRSTEAARQAAQAAREAAQAQRAPAGAGVGGGSLQGALAVAGGIGIATSIGGITAAIVSLGTATVQTGAQLEQLRASLAAIAGSAGAGQQQFQALFATAQRLGVAFEPLAQGWRQLTAAASQANFPVQEQQRLLTALTNEARRTGVSSEGLSRIITGVAQVFSKGTLSMEEMRQQIGENLPTAFGALARGMGRSTEELTKFISTGSVGAVSSMRALTRGLEEIGQTSGKMADTTVQAFNRLKNSWLAFQEALFASGVGKYFADVANNLREAVEWSTRLLRARPDPRLFQGPTPEGRPLGMGGTEEQQKELRRLEGLITPYSRLAETAPNPAHRAQYAEMVANAKAMREQILQNIEGTQAQAVEQAKVTAEVNKTNAVQEQQAEFVADVRKGLEAVRKAQADFRKEAEIAPGRLGRPQGTPEEMTTYLKGQEQAIREPLEKLGTLLAKPPAGTTLPADLRKDYADLDTQLAGFGTTIDAIREKEQARERAAREAETARKKALQDDLQAIRERAQAAEQAANQEISLTQDLARVKAFIAGPEESVAAQARVRVEAQGAAMQETIAKALRQFEQSAALTELAPGLLQQFQALKASLPGAIEAQGLQAFNDAIKKNALEPLQQLADAYGLTKEARDADKASTLAAMAVGTQYEAETKKLAETVGNLAKLQERLNREAAASEHVGMAAVKAATEEEAALQTLRENLEQARTPRGGEGFPFERTREELRLQQRTEKDILTPAGQQEAEDIQQARLAQEQLNYAVDLFEDLAGGVGSAWIQALTSIVDGTKTVSEAFRAMGQSILKTMADIAAQEATKSFIRLAGAVLTTALTGALTPTAAPTEGGGGLATFIGQTLGSQADLGLGGMGGGAATSPYAFGEFQHGGIIHSPTRLLAGENPSTAPEAIFNRQQLQSLFGGGAGGLSQGANKGISIINVASREQAEQTAAQERGLGREVVLNYIMQDLSQGEGSKVNQMMRRLQR